MAGRRPLALCMVNESEWGRHKAALERHGYHVLAVNGDREALSLLRKNPVDAVILDIDPLGIHGSTVVRRLKEMKPHIPLLVLVSPFTKIPATTFRVADAVMLKTDAPSRLTRVVDKLLTVEYPFFTRWFGNWRHRAGA